MTISRRTFNTALAASALAPFGIARG